MKTLSRHHSIAVFALLAVVMLATRCHQFGSALHLSDASMALFFLGGLFVRQHKGFVGLLVLAVAIDYVSIDYLGVSDYCVTAAYAFLPAAYAVLWYAGRGFVNRLEAKPVSLALATVVAFAAASMSYLISNGSFYWLGGRVAETSMSGYLANAWHWGPMFVETTMLYSVIGLAVYAAFASLPRHRGVATSEA